MTQPSLFSQEVRNNKQPQRAASKAHAAQPSTGPSRQTAAAQNRLTQSQPASNGVPSNQVRNAPVPFPGRPEDPGNRGICLTGRIGRYFEVKQTSTGKSLATFSLATVKPYRDESGNWAKRTVWQRIVAWGETAESLSAQLEKGVRVSVEGRFKTREWVDRENNLRTTTELVARQVQFLDAAAA
jgi:hypothetical protein